MLSGEAAIADALFTHLAALSFSPPLLVAYPNLSFTPPAGAYLETSFQPNRAPARPIGFDEVPGAIGIFQVSVNWPSGQGVIKAYDAAQAIKEHFKAGTVLTADGTRVRIVTDPSTAPHVTLDNNRVLVPVTIPWVVWA